MKRPKRLLEDGEFSNIVVRVCLFLVSIAAFFVFLQNQNNVLSSQERLVYCVGAIIAAVIWGTTLFFTYKKIKMRKEGYDTSECENNANEGGHKDDV